MVLYIGGHPLRGLPQGSRGALTPWCLSDLLCLCDQIPHYLVTKLNPCNPSVQTHGLFKGLPHVYYYYLPQTLPSNLQGWKQPWDSGEGGTQIPYKIGRGNHQKFSKEPLAIFNLIIVIFIIYVVQFYEHTVLCKSNKSEFRWISSNFDEYRRKPAIFQRIRKFFEVSKKFWSAIVLTCSIFRLIVRNITRNFERYFVWWNEFSSEVSLSVLKFRLCVIKLKRNFVHFQWCFELTFAAVSWWQQQSTTINWQVASVKNTIQALYDYI